MVIFCNPSGYGYIKKNDKKRFLADSLRGSEINATISILNKIIDLQLGRKKLSEAKDSNSNNIMILNVLFVVGLLLALIMYIMVLSEVTDFKEKFIVIPIIILLIIIFLGMIVMLMGLV